MHRLLLLFVITLFLTSCKKETKIVNDGFIHGTTYHIIYYSQNGENLQEEIEAEMHKVDSSWSTYLPISVVSRINSNEPNVELDDFFVTVFNNAYEISTITDGAFDMTVAPLVNAWGFGFEKIENVDSSLIDSLLNYVGYQKLTISNNNLTKENPNIKIDANAIAKGFSVDIVSNFLELKGINRYLVEIGGEVRAKGNKPDGSKWKVGIDKPINEVVPKTRELQDIIQIENIAMATSGNYRQFYMKDGAMYSHTIDPKTGFPVNHSLLSATVLAKDCMIADAFATAFMVLGLEKSKKLVHNNPNIEAYFIYANNAGAYQVYMTDKIKDLIISN